jgi:hypothetical protein
VSGTSIRDRLRTRAKLNRPVNPRTAAAVAARKGRPLLFSFEPAWALDIWTDGGYPIGFLERAYVTLGVTDPSRVLHLFGGGPLGGDRRYSRGDGADGGR